jgi:hypothetical protein
MKKMYTFSADTTNSKKTNAEPIHKSDRHPFTLVPHLMVAVKNPDGVGQERHGHGLVEKKRQPTTAFCVAF